MRWEQCVERGRSRSWCLDWLFQPGFYLPPSSSSPPCPPHCLLPAHFTPATPPPPITVLTDFSSTVFTVLERYQRPKSCPTGLIHCLKWIKKKDALIIFIMKAYKIHMLCFEGFSLVNQYHGWMVLNPLPNWSHHLSFCSQVQLQKCTNKFIFIQRANYVHVAKYMLEMKLPPYDSRRQSSSWNQK